MKRVLYFHLIPLVFSLTASCLIFLTATSFLQNRQTAVNEINIRDEANKTSFKFFQNYEADYENKILHLARSCQNKTVILFGSSELTYDEKTPYYFFSDSVLRITGIGEAYNETFTVYSQLLAMGEHARNSNICIILSAGWFGDGEGTNIQAFLKTTPELMQKMIWQNKTDEEFKNYFYSYMFKHKSEINTLPKTYSLLANLSPDNILHGPNRMLASSFLTEKINLHFNAEENQSPCINPFTLSWDSILKKDQDHFLTTCDSNNIYVYNEYYSENLLEPDGSLKFSTAPNIPFPNTELEDLKMLLKLLKYYNCKASFIMEGLNPHYYHSMEKYSPLMDSIQSYITDKYQYPYFNMFVTDTANYHPGDLMDVMHLGRPGWDKVNRFIYETYCDPNPKP